MERSLGRKDPWAWVSSTETRMNTGDRWFLGFDNRKYPYIGRQIVNYLPVQ